MWPTIFEFSWDTGHMIFFGVFYAVLIILATSITYAVAKSIVDVFSGVEAKDGAPAPLESRNRAEEVDESTQPAYSKSTPNTKAVEEGEV